MSHLEIFNSIKDKEAHIKETKKSIYKDLKELTQDFDDYYYSNIHHSFDNAWFSIVFCIPVKNGPFSLMSVSLSIKNELRGTVEHSSVNINTSNHPMSAEDKLLYMYGDEIKNNFDELGGWTKDEFPTFINQFTSFDKYNNKEILFTDFMRRSFQEIICPSLKNIKFEKFKPTDTIACIDDIHKQFELLVTSLETKTNMFEADDYMFEMIIESLKSHETKKMHHDLDMSLASKATGTRKKI